MARGTVYISHYALMTVSGPVSMQLHAILFRFHQMIHELQTVAVLTSLEAVPSVDQARHQFSLILWCHGNKSTSWHPTLTHHRYGSLQSDNLTVIILFSTTFHSSDSLRYQCSIPNTVYPNYNPAEKNIWTEREREREQVTGENCVMRTFIIWSHHWMLLRQSIAEAWGGWDM